MIHFDHAATGLPRLPLALKAAVEASALPSPGRGRHGPQARAQAIVEQARVAVGALVGGAHVVCFTAGVTAALNQAIAGWRPRPRMLALGPLLHNAAARPARALGQPCWTLPCDASGHIDVQAARRVWPEHTDLVVLSHGSNVTGLVQPLGPLLSLAHERGAAVLVDAAQTTGLLDLEPLRAADAIALSAHKGLRALPGVGALLLDPRATLEPLVRGGVGFDARSTDVPDELPERLESGTPNLPGIAAMGAAARALELPSRPRLAELRGALEAAVSQAGLERVGDGELPVVSVRHAAVSAPELENALDRVYGITCRAGLHCAPDAHTTLGSIPTGTLRFSAATCTKIEEMSALTAALSELVPALDAACATR